MYNLTKILLFTIALTGSAYYGSSLSLAEDHVAAVEKPALRGCQCTRTREDGVKAYSERSSGEGFASKAISQKGDNVDCGSACVASGFVFRVKGDNEFFHVYTRNRPDFELGPHHKIKVLANVAGIDIESGYPNNAGSITKVVPLSTGVPTQDHRRRFEFFNTNKLSIEARRSIGDASYGGFVEANFSRDTTRAENAYLFLETDYGTFSMGRIQKNATDEIRVDASSVATIKGEAVFFRETQWAKYINTKGRALDAEYRPARGQAAASSKRHRDSHYCFMPYPTHYLPTPFSPKIRFISAGFGNLRLAAGYAMDVGGNLYRNFFDFGVQYSGMAKGLKYAVSLTGQTSQRTPEGKILHHPHKAFDAGAMIQMGSVKLSGSFGSNGLSGIEKTMFIDADQSKARADGAQYVVTDGGGSYVTIGAAYEEGPIAFSVNYLETQQTLAKKIGANKLSIVSLGAQYRVAGDAYEFTPYASAKYLATEEAGIGLSDNNRVLVLVSGVKVSY